MSSQDEDAQPPPDPFGSDDLIDEEDDVAGKTFVDDLETPEPADALTSQDVDLGHDISDVVLIETESARLPSAEELEAGRSDRLELGSDLGEVDPYEQAPTDGRKTLASGSSESTDEPREAPLTLPGEIVFDPEEHSEHPSADNLTALRGNSGKFKALTPPRGIEEASSVDRSGQPMIHLNDVYKAFGKREILRGVELAIYPGETVCIIGGSGTGKSVSLKHIMRLLDPDRGKIWLDGEDITEAHGDRLQEARRKLGVNFQFGALLNWLTVFENVALPLRENTDMLDDEIERRVMSKLELLKIPHARDLFPTQISGGMVKRAGLARAVVMEESLKVILYDEPTSGLDPISTALVDEMVNEIKHRLGLTQVIVTHDMASAYRVADRIAVLFEGQVVQFGTPYEIQNSTVPYVQQFVRGLSSAEQAEEVIQKRKTGKLGKKVTE